MPPELGRLLESEWTLIPTVDNLFSPEEIKDDELRVMFSCCDRRINTAGQVALILNILCGFSVDEVAAAFFNSHAAVEKRLTRAKKTLASSHQLFDVTRQADFDERITSVHHALYLLFNEGYHGSSVESAVRQEFCSEGLRLVKILIDHPFGAVPTSYALAALMCLRGARLITRLSPGGELTPLSEQDRSLWNQDLIKEGARFLELSVFGDNLSEYHIEAMIAMVHASAASIDDTDWPFIVGLYDMLIALRPSPVVALNRAIALARHEGPRRGLEEVEAIVGKDRMLEYPFYFATIGELNFLLGNFAEASKQLLAARSVSRSEAERRFFSNRICAIETATSEGRPLPSQLLEIDLGDLV